MKRGPWVGLLILSMMTAAPAATYYVARSEPGASDASDGLAPTASGNGKGPWLTIQKAADAAKPGDTVLVGKGTYAEAVQLKQSRVTFRSLQPSERPRIDGGGERRRGIYIVEGRTLEDVVIEGFEIAHQTDVGIYAGTGQAKRFTVRDNLIHHVPSQGIRLGGTGHQVYKNVIYMIGNNQEAMGILLAAASDCRVQDNDVFLCKKTAIRDQSGKRNLIEGNLMHECWTGLDYNACSGTKAFNNYIYDNSQGFNPKHVKGHSGWNLFWHNTVHNSHGPHISIAVNRAENSEGPGPDCDYLDIRNNVLVKAGHTHIWNKPDIVGEHLVINGNLYYGPPGRPSFFYHVDWPRGGRPGLTTLDEMRRNTPFAANDRFADPQLIDPEAGDLDYRDTSPAAVGGAKLDSPFGTQLGARGVRRPATRFLPVTLKAIAASVNENLMGYTTDGRYCTGWHSGTETANQWIVYQVQGDEAFTHLILVPTAHKVEFNVRRYEFSVSDDSRTYRLIAAGENNDSGSWFLYEFEKPVAARFIRFSMVDKFSDDGLAWTLNRLEFDELLAGRFDPPLPGIQGLLQ